MKRKELEALNNELIVKVEKQNSLIEKLQEELKIEKGLAKTVYVEKATFSKPSILDNYGTDLLLESSMDIGGKLIFRLIDNKTPLDMISFEDWVKGLTRENLIGELRCNNQEAFNYLDQLDLATIKSFFRTSLKEYYEKEKKTYIKRLNRIIYETYNNEKEEARGGE